MTNFTCYRLHDTLGGVAATDLDDYIDLADEQPQTYGPASFGDFIAKLYLSSSEPHPPLWEGFIRSGFDPIEPLPLATSTGAAIVVELQPGGQHFAFTFGTLGRFLLKQEAWQRGYGLRAALNLIYPRGNTSGSGKLVAVDAKQRAGNIMRSRRQASRATSFEAFGVNTVRDLMGGATGMPQDQQWGRRVTGGDALHFDADTQFEELGKLCRALQEAHDKDDYSDKFGWINRIRPIHDPAILQEVEGYLADRLARGDITDLGLAPPEIIDWSTVTGFRYHFDARKKFWRPELRIQDYLHGLDDTGDLDVAFLKSRHVWAVDSDNRQAYKWPVWRCLTGEFEYKGVTYIADEGEIFSVSQDYLRVLNGQISAIPLAADIPWPNATRSTQEGKFNEDAAKAIPSALLLDKKLVNASTQTTPIEVCDILTAKGRLIHVKRHLGSSDLSHLFSQGFVSARLLQEDADFRTATADRIASLTTDPAFSLFGPSLLKTDDFEVVYAIVAPWRGRSAAEALPFFSKANLEQTVQELTSRGFRVALSQVDTG